MGKAELMQEKISELRKLPLKIKEKLKKIIFANFIIAIIFMLCLVIINSIYLNKDLEFFQTSVKAFAMVLIILDVILFETAYRKDSVTLWVYGFELLSYSILILAISYLYVYMNEIIRNLLMLAPIFFSIYYLAKTIIIHVIETKKYQNNLSDVKEIMQDEEKGYLDD